MALEIDERERSSPEAGKPIDIRNFGRDRPLPSRLNPAIAVDIYRLVGTRKNAVVEDAQT